MKLASSHTRSRQLLCKLGSHTSPGSLAATPGTSWPRRSLSRRTPGSAVSNARGAPARRRRRCAREGEQRSSTGIVQPAPPVGAEGEIQRDHGGSRIATSQVGSRNDGFGARPVRLIRWSRARMASGFGFQALVLILLCAVERFATMQEIQAQSLKPEARRLRSAVRHAPQSPAPAPPPACDRER